MKALGKIFATGLLTVLPLLATVYLLVWIFVTAESFFGNVLAWVLPRESRMPGMGIAFAALIVFGVGILMRAWVIRALFHKVEEALLRIPLINSIYSALRDLFSLLTSKDKDDDLQLVSLTLPGTSLRLMGFVTRSDFSALPEGFAGDDEVAVYLPMSYQVGGYTVFVPRADLVPVNMPREAAMRFILTAGVNGGARKTAARE